MNHQLFAFSRRLVALRHPKEEGPAKHLVSSLIVEADLVFTSGNEEKALSIISALEALERAKWNLFHLEKGPKTVLASVVPPLLIKKKSGASKEQLETAYVFLTFGKPEERKQI